MLLKRTRDDGGQALVMVIGMMVLSGTMLAVIASSLIFAVNYGTQTRASIQSVAAADAGLNSVTVAIFAGGTPCGAGGVVDNSAAAIPYKATVYRKATSTSSYVAGCPTASDYSFKVQVTGYAKQQGAMGFDNGDVQKVEAEFVKPPQPPVFDYAVRGDVVVESNGIAAIQTATGVPNATIYTKGTVQCPSGILINGDLVVEKDVVWNNGCRLLGNAYVGGNLVSSSSYSASTRLIEGSLTVLGKIQSYVGQATPVPTTTTQAVNAGGNIRTGSWVTGYCSYPGPASGATFTGFSSSSCPGGTTYGTHIRMNQTGLTLPTASPYPKVDTTTVPWASYATKAWTDYTGNSVTSGVCRHSAATTMTVLSNTRIDVRSACPSGLVLGTGGNLTINLSADLVLYANFIKVNGNVTVNSADGATHNVYLIDPAPASFSTCPTPNTDPYYSPPDPDTSGTGIVFSSGLWTQDSKIKILAYTTDGFKAKQSGLKLRGQVYACSTDMESGFSLIYDPVGDSSGGGGTTAYTTSYIRQTN